MTSSKDIFLENFKNIRMLFSIDPGFLVIVKMPQLIPVIRAILECYSTVNNNKQMFFW